MFNLGIQAEKIYRKPHIPLLQEDNVRKGFFEHGEFIALRNASPEYFKPVLTFAYFTGWRKLEILSLRWNQVDLNARTVRLDPGTTKSKEGPLVMLEDELLEAIQEQWERRKVAETHRQSPTLLCPFVFHRNGRPLGDIRTCGRPLVSRPGFRGSSFTICGALLSGTWSARAYPNAWP
jgi:integrase